MNVVVQKTWPRRSRRKTPLTAPKTGTAARQRVQNNLTGQRQRATPFFRETQPGVDFLDSPPGSTTVIDRGSPAGAPTTDSGFDPRCIRAVAGRRLSWWQYAPDYGTSRAWGVWRVLSSHGAPPGGGPGHPAPTTRYGGPSIPGTGGTAGLRVRQVRRVRRFGWNDGFRWESRRGERRRRGPPPPGRASRQRRASAIAGNSSGCPPVSLAVNRAINLAQPRTDGRRILGRNGKRRWAPPDPAVRRGPAPAGGCEWRRRPARSTWEAVAGADARRMDPCTAGRRRRSATGGSATRNSRRRRARPVEYSTSSAHHRHSPVEKSQSGVAG